MGKKDACIGDEEFKFKTPATDLVIHTHVNCFSHCVCSERGKVNSPLLCKASSCTSVLKKFAVFGNAGKTS